jgi:hypothetical protein
MTEEGRGKRKEVNAKVRVAIGDMPANPIRYYDIYALSGHVRRADPLVRGRMPGESDREMAAYSSHLVANVLA